MQISGLNLPQIEKEHIKIVMYNFCCGDMYDKLFDRLPLFSEIGRIFFHKYTSMHISQHLPWTQV